MESGAKVKLYYNDKGQKDLLGFRDILQVILEEISSSNIMKLLPISLSFKDYFLALMLRLDLKLGNRTNSASTFQNTV